MSGMGTPAKDPVIGQDPNPRRKSEVVTLVGADGTELRIGIQELGVLGMIGTLKKLKAIHGVLQEYRDNGGELVSPIRQIDGGQLAFDTGVASDWLGILLAVLDKAGNDLVGLIKESVIRGGTGTTECTSRMINEMSLEETISLLQAFYRVNASNLVGKALAWLNRKPATAETPSNEPANESPQLSD